MEIVLIILCALDLVLSVVLLVLFFLSSKKKGVGDSKGDALTKEELEVMKTALVHQA